MIIAMNEKLAWYKLETALKSVGRWRAFTLDDSCIHAVIADMGGWMVFCEADREQLLILKNKFLKLYRIAFQLPPTNYPAVLCGDKSENTSAVRLFGDQEKAAKIVEQGHCTDDISYHTYTCEGDDSLFEKFGDTTGEEIYIERTGET